MALLDLASAKPHRAFFPFYFYFPSPRCDFHGRLVLNSTTVLESKAAENIYTPGLQELSPPFQAFSPCCCYCLASPYCIKKIKSNQIWTLRRAAKYKDPGKEKKGRRMSNKGKQLGKASESTEGTYHPRQDSERSLKASGASPRAEQARGTPRQSPPSITPTAHWGCYTGNRPPALHG